jgi:DNA-binding phage protein
MKLKSNKVKKVAKKKSLPDPYQEEATKRADWEHNNELIYSAFIDVATEKKRYPKLREIAEKTGLSITTIFKHTQDPDFDTLKKKYSVFSDAALMQLASKAISGKSKDWMELYFRVVEGVGDKKQLDITSKGKQIGGLDLSALSDEELSAFKSIKQKLNGS